ncbi:aminoglycoside phosphotransferase family protein [Thiomicrorhabdus lithotrophica]|uniref:Phosphotransferase n=1 Tax=Thiomicrorhabdus lithotrophica TaxID=2949997 RepID=A0ABY8CB85_9GAMM|nr:phosphotransferase [Thiomicrorhabdus lithotrophica]WEJ63250.1 phosphotransferase [Thiomicrorhabdus lithotrophica]
MNERFQMMLDWLQSLSILKDCEVTNPVSASSDASFRRYFRIEAKGASGQHSYIIMDAPVEHEDCRPFIAVSEQLVSMGLTVPEVLAQNLTQGFLLLTDLGSTTYLSVLEQAEESTVDRLYGDALEALVCLQTKGNDAAQNLPSYNESLFTTEMSLFSDWLLSTHLEIGLNKLENQAWQSVQNTLIKSALKQPQVYVHRDYHSRNLMVLDEANPGILDFQDAVKGPLTYDAVSMLRDCYIAWPEEQVVEWQRNYFLQLCQQNMMHREEWESFQKSMDLMGVQRHLKASGIFARLFHRDGKEGYLDDIPLTLDYLVKVGAKYSEMTSLLDLVEAKVLPKISTINQAK